jgi:predicted nucleic acid-binding protein
MPYLVDSDWVIDHLAGDSVAQALIAHLAPQQIAVSIITYIEAFQGTLREPDPAAAQVKLNAFLSSAPIVPISIAVAERCAHVREQLRRQGKRAQRRAMDLLIASTALEHNLTLVTRNKDDYKDIPGLSLY